VRAGVARIFSAIGDFSPVRVALVVDPQRKGCNEKVSIHTAAARLSRAGDRVRYHDVQTQARDIGWVVPWSADEVAEGKNEGKDVLESLRGFDLSPPTAHTESVVVFKLAL
jgi:tRNA/tmRNA/rRNA uracil-C5-methylase (TrmA/RlmC/RlmD family)